MNKIHMITVVVTKLLVHVEFARYASQSEMSKARWSYATPNPIDSLTLGATSS